MCGVLKASSGVCHGDVQQGARHCLNFGCMSFFLLVILLSGCLGDSTFVFAVCPAVQLLASVDVDIPLLAVHSFRVVTSGQQQVLHIILKDYCTVTFVVHRSEVADNKHLMLVPLFRLVWCFFRSRRAVQSTTFCGCALVVGVSKERIYGAEAVRLLFISVSFT